MSEEIVFYTNPQSRGRIEKMEELRRGYAITEDALNPNVDDGR